MSLFKKPKGIRYTQMAMWIDANIHNDEFDENKAYEYMYLLAQMLAYKHRYFRNTGDYEGFACYLAYSVYTRLSDKSKPPIKSVLNYMKAIIYFRKVAYEQEHYIEIINPQYNKSWDSDVYREKSIAALESENRQIIESTTLDVLASISKTIYNCIPVAYKADKLTYENLYKSALISMLYKFTLPDIKQQSFNRRMNSGKKFNIVNYYRLNLKEEIKLWHLDESMEDVVRLIINKANQSLINNVKEIIDYYKISEKQFNDMSVDNIFNGEMINE